MYECFTSKCVYFVCALHEEARRGHQFLIRLGVSLTTQPALQPQGVDLPSLELCVSLD